MSLAERLEALERLEEPRGVEALIAALLPGLPLRFEGVSHVAAGVLLEDAFELFRIGHRGAPSSRLDRFLLDVARLRADAIVLTGAILRAEPALVYEFDPAWRAPFTALRRALGLSPAPRLFVLTARGDLDRAHPLFSHEGGVTIVGPAESSLTHAIERAREGGARAISIEAGASASASLYAEGPPPDELLFHRFALELSVDARAGAFTSARRVSELFGPPRSSVDAEERGLRSVVERYAR